MRLFYSSREFMKLHQLFLTFLLLFAAFQFCLSQEKPKAVLDDKFGAIINDDLLARIDGFFQNITADKNSKGYIIVHGTKNNSLLKYTFERHIKGCFRWANFPENNFTFVLAEDRDKFEVELWKVPNGAEKPQFIETPRDYKILELTKPRYVYKLNIDDSYCPLFFNMEFYSNLLKANPNLIGKIIIYEKALKNYQKEKLKYSRELVKTYRISPQQMIFVRGKYYGEPDAEFLLVPKKKK